MRLLTRILVACLACLAGSHLVAVYAESAVAARLSWLLIYALVLVVPLALADWLYHVLGGDDE